MSRLMSDDNKSSVLTSNTGAPQDCVLSPFLFSVYTNSESECMCWAFRIQSNKLSTSYFRNKFSPLSHMQVLPCH